jgi:transposase
MGTRTPDGTLTESRGGPAPAGNCLYVGIDVGRRQHVVAAISQERMENGSWERAGVHRFATSGRGFRELTSWLESFDLEPQKIHIGCEPTGGWYAQTVAAWLERHDYQVSWLQNWALHERRQLAIGKQTKTDALDARLIARLLYERDRLGIRRGFLHRIPHSTDAIRMLVRNRAKLVEQRTRYRLQLTAIEDVLFPELKDFFKTTITGPAARHLLEAYATPDQVAAAEPADLYDVVVKRGHAGRLASCLMDLQLVAADSAGLVHDIDPILQAQDWLLYQMRLLDGQIDSVEDAIANALQAWPAKQRAILDSLPGMSTMRQAILLSTIGDLSTFREDRQLRKLLGWYPEARESGSSLSKHRLGHSGNRMARREIWLWALQLLAPQHPPTPFRAYYQRLRDCGMPGHVAIGHLAGKLISVLFFCLQSGQLYDPGRHARDLGLSEPGWARDGRTPTPDGAPEED